MAIKNGKQTINSANVKYTCCKYLNHIETGEMLYDMLFPKSLSDEMNSDENTGPDKKYP